MSEAGDLVREMVRRADVSAVAAVYDAVSVSTRSTRTRLARSGLKFVQSGQATPRPEELERTSNWLISQAKINSGALGGLAGLAGWLSIPPEVAGYLVSMLRLGQRLAVTYGLDPETERGRLALAQALAAGFEVEMPERGIMGLRATEFAKLLVTRTPDSERMGGQLALALVFRATRLMGGRLARLVPVLSSGVSALDNRRATQEIGRRMRDTLRRLAELPQHAQVLIEDAHEVR
jgi:hypothetical protein